MADADEAQTQAEGTGVSEVTQSTDDVELEDIELSDTDIEDTSEEAEESPASESEADDNKEVDETDELEQSDEAAADDEEEPQSEKKEFADISDEEARKRYNDEMAKRRIAEKQLRQEREQREQENLQRYLAEAQDDEVELERRKAEVERYNLQREKAGVLQEKLSVGIDKAIATIDLFRTGTDEVKEELAKSLDDFEKMHVKKDKNGNYLSVDADVYQFLQEKADSIRRLTGIGARQQAKQKATEKMRTVTPPTRTPKEPKVDPDLADFDKGWD